MKCPMETGETGRLLAYSTGSAETEFSAEWKQHLASCGACREFVTGQQAVWEALDGWKAPEASADFDRRLLRRIEQEATRQVWWMRWLSPSGSAVVRRGLPVAVAAGLLIVAGWILERPAANRASQQRTSPVEGVQPEQVEHALDDLQMLSDFTNEARSNEGGEL